MNPPFKKARNILDFVWDQTYSSFYYQKYSDAKIDLRNVKSWDDFHKLPYLQKSEINSVSLYKRLYAPRSKLKAIGVTSGTTDARRPSILPATLDYPLALKKANYGEPVRVGVKTLLHVTPVLNSLGTVLRLYDYCLNVLGDVNNPELTAQLAAQLEVDGLRATSSQLYRFLPYLEKVYDLDRIKFIRAGMEYCSEQMAKYLKSKFKKAFFEFSFASTETNILGTRCGELAKMAPRFFHPIPVFYYEIDSSNGGSELIVTHLFKALFPVIRYRTGTTVKFEERKCFCGNNTTMEVLGKLEGELINVRGTTIYANFLKEAISQFVKQLDSTNYELHVYEQIKKGGLFVKLKLKVIPKSSNPQRLKSLKKAMSDSISQNLRVSIRSTLADAVDQGIFLPLEIDFVRNLPQDSKPIISHIL